MPNKLIIRKVIFKEAELSIASLTKFNIYTSIVTQSLVYLLQ